MLLENGRYQYGYFPHFDKEIGTYNVLRHSSSTYALIEGLTYLNQPLDSAEKAIDYIIENYVFEKMISVISLMTLKILMKLN